MHAELRWSVFTLNMVTRRNRVIAVVSWQITNQHCAVVSDV